MNVECQLNQLRGLIKLLRVEDDNSDSDTEVAPPKPTLLEGPGCVKPKPSTSTPKEPKEPSPYEKVESAVESSAWEEYEHDVTHLPQPEYKISYKQSVATEDLYLGIGSKSPAIACCEDIVLEIRIPEETVGIEEMAVNVTEHEVHFASPKYNTKIPLPYAVDPNKGKALYNREHRILKLTLRMRRELEFANV